MEENSIVTEEELNSFLNNLELKFIAQKLKIENVDKSIITLLKIVKNLQQENKQLKSILNEIEYFVSNEYSFDEFGMKMIDKSKLEDKIQELKILGGDKE